MRQVLDEEERKKRKKESLYRASRKYLEKFSKIEVRVPIERKELYKTAAGNKSMCAYVIGLIEEDIRKRNIQ